MNEVERMLMDSVSLDGATRHAAMDRLSRFETESPEFVIELLKLGASQNEQMRFLSLCCCRNIIGRLIGKLRPETIEEIKCVLIELLGSSIESIQIMRKIVKVSSWPALVDWFCSHASVSDQYAFILYQYVKELEQKRLLAGRKENFLIAPRILESVLPIWFDNPTNRYLDCAVLRLCRIGFSSFSAHAIHSRIIASFVAKLEVQSEPNGVEKRWKDLSNSFEKETAAFQDNIGINGMYELAVKAIHSGRGREYPVNVIHHIVTSQKDFSVPLEIIEAVINRFLLLSESDVAEWLEAMDESLGGPLDGHPARQAAEYLLIDTGNAETIKFALSRIESLISKGDYGSCLLDAWLAMLVVCHGSIVGIETILTPLIVSVLKMGSPITRFRVIQLIRVSQLSNEYVHNLIPLLIELLNSNSVLSLSVFFALKALFDRSFDDPIWHQVAPSMIQAALQLLSQVSAADVVWRLLNAITLLMSEGSGLVSDQSFHVIHTLFTGKDFLIKSAIIDLVKAALVTADDVGDGANDQLVNFALSVATHALSIEDDESMMFEGALSILIAVIRVSSDLASTRNLVTQIMTSRVWMDKSCKELLELLIDFDVLAIENASIHDINIGIQLEICRNILNDPDSDALADLALVLLEVLTVADSNRAMFNLDWFVKLIHLSAIRDEDRCPVPLDGVVQLVTTLAVVCPEKLAQVERIGDLCPAMWRRVITSRLGRTKVRLINAIAVMGGGIGKDKLVAVLESVDDDLVTVSSKIFLGLRSNRFEGIPKPVRREAFLNSIRNVDVEALKHRLS